MIKYCMENLHRPKSDILRLGIRKVYEEIKGTAGKQAVLEQRSPSGSHSSFSHYFAEANQRRPPYSERLFSFFLGYGVFSSVRSSRQSTLTPWNLDTSISRRSGIWTSPRSQLLYTRWLHPKYSAICVCVKSLSSLKFLILGYIIFHPYIKIVHKAAVCTFLAEIPLNFISDIPLLSEQSGTNLRTRPTSFLLKRLPPLSCVLLCLFLLGQLYQKRPG